MSASPSRLTDHAVEQFVGRLLQIGVAIAAAVTLTGGVLLLRRHSHEVPDYHEFRGVSEPLTSLAGIFHGPASGDARSIIQCGLLLLIATPIIRVAFTWVAFLIQRDRVYVAVTTIVLALLLYGLLYGKA
jgi:uncharacterized membrane protein